MDISKMRQDIERFMTEAEDYLESQFPSAHYKVRTAVDDAVDAFRHAYVFGRLAQTYGATTAFLLGLGNELKEGNTPEARDMDIYNNSVGIDFAEAASNPRALADRVVQGIRDGELVIRPGEDPRALPGFGSGASLIAGDFERQLHQLVSLMAAEFAPLANASTSHQQLQNHPFNTVLASPTI